jgi:hypothetical protein
MHLVYADDVPPEPAHRAQNVIQYVDAEHMAGVESGATGLRDAVHTENNPNPPVN